MNTQASHYLVLVCSSACSTLLQQEVLFPDWPLSRTLISYCQADQLNSNLLGIVGQRLHTGHWPIAITMGNDGNEGEPGKAAAAMRSARGGAAMMNELGNGELRQWGALLSPPPVEKLCERGQPSLLTAPLVPTPRERASLEPRDLTIILFCLAVATAPGHYPEPVRTG